MFHWHRYLDLNLIYIPGTRSSLGTRCCLPGQGASKRIQGRYLRQTRLLVVFSSAITVSRLFLYPFSIESKLDSRIKKSDFVLFRYCLNVLLIYSECMSFLTETDA